MLMPVALLANCSSSLKISFTPVPVSLAHPVSWLPKKGGRRRTFFYPGIDVFLNVIAVRGEGIANFPSVLLVTGYIGCVRVGIAL